MRVNKPRGRAPEKGKLYSEKLIHRYLKQAIKDGRGIAYKNHPLTDEGIPDLIVHWRGMTFYVETKTTGKECTEQQKEFHAKLRRIGIQTYVLDVKITNIYDLWIYCYTTYPSKYFVRNPWRAKDIKRYEDAPLRPSVEDEQDKVFADDNEVRPLSHRR